MGEALMRRRRLHLRHLTRARAEVGEREVSPQRLVHYKTTWTLDAWCHQRDRLLAGGTRQQAVLCFSPQAAPWISREA